MAVPGTGNSEPRAAGDASRQLTLSMVNKDEASYTRNPLKSLCGSVLQEGTYDESPDSQSV